jgi:D-inositol-3-phosphate glycosyltransferase
MRGAKMRIAVLSIHSCPMSRLGTRTNGGMSVYVRETARELGRQGHVVDIYTGWWDGDHRKIMDLAGGVRLIHLAGRTGRPSSYRDVYSLLPEYFRELGAYLEREKQSYDLVHSHYWLSGVMGEWAREKWNLPHALMFHTIGAAKNESHPEEQEPELRLQAEKELARFCTRVLATSEDEKRSIVRHCETPPGKVSVVPCGVNLERFRPLEQSVARSRLGIGQRDRVLLFVGRFAPIKGIDRLIGAMAGLKHRADTRLILVGGDGPRAPETLRFKRQVRELGVEGSVEFAGRVVHEHLPEYYAAADVVVIPSYSESFGLVAIEALACGTPVLASRVGVIGELLQDSGLGQIIQDMSPPRLAEGIDRYLSWLENHRPSSSRVRSAILHLEWSGIASALLERYREISRLGGAERSDSARLDGG